MADPRRNVMTAGDVLPYPIPNDAALMPPTEWRALRQLQVTLEVLLRKLPTLELAVSTEELQRVEGLAVGGLSEVPVRW